MGKNLHRRRDWIAHRILSDIVYYSPWKVHRCSRWSRTSKLVLVLVSCTGSKSGLHWTVVGVVLLCNYERLYSGRGTRDCPRGRGQPFSPQNKGSLRRDRLTGFLFSKMLVFLRSSILSSERPRDVFLRRPIKVNRIKGRCALFGHSLPIAGIFTRLPRGAELGEGFVYR